MSKTVVAILAALAGTAVGMAGQWMLLRAGLTGLMIVGFCAGLGAEWARARSPLVPWITAALALVGMVLVEWMTRPFIADESLGYFLMHLMDLPGFTMLMVALGVAIAWWFPFSRMRDGAGGQKGDAQRE